MPVIWNLKKWLAIERDIYRPVELQRLLAEKAGVQLSLQAVSALINGKPSAFRVTTLQALCNALNCELNDFCQIKPDSPEELKKQREAVGEAPIRPYGSKQKSKAKKTKTQESIFPDPHEFIAPDEEQREII